MVTEESVKETVKTIAQGMPDDCGVPLVANACAFLLHRRPRVQRAPGIPCALGFFDGHFSSYNSGVTCRGKADSYLDAVIARSDSDEAIQCCEQSPGLLRFARNDGRSELLFENRIQSARAVQPACPAGIAPRANSLGAPRPASRSACTTASVSTAMAVA